MILAQFIQHDTTEFQMKRTNEKEDDKKKRVQFTCLKFTVSELAFFSRLMMCGAFTIVLFCLWNLVLIYLKAFAST